MPLNQSEAGYAWSGSECIDTPCRVGVLVGWFCVSYGQHLGNVICLWKVCDMCILGVQYQGDFEKIASCKATQ